MSEINIKTTVKSAELGDFQFDLTARNIGAKYLVKFPEPLFGCMITFANSMVSAIHSVLGDYKFSKAGFSINSTFQMLGNGYFAVRQGTNSVLVHPLSKFAVEVVTAEDKEPFQYTDGKDYIDFVQLQYQTSTESLILVISQGLKQRTIEAIDWRSLKTTEVEPLPFNNDDGN